MSSRWLSCFLVALIAMQSVLAIADTHDFMQESSNHSEFFEDSAEKVSADDLQDSVDCSHCCHCHSNAQLLGVNVDVIDFAPASQAPSAYINSSYSYLTSPDIRPPIL